MPSCALRCEITSETLIVSVCSSRYVLNELIETEKDYVADLGLIVEVNLTVCTDIHPPSLSKRGPNPNHRNPFTSLHALVCFHPTVSSPKQISWIISLRSIILQCNPSPVALNSSRYFGLERNSCHLKVNKSLALSGVGLLLFAVMT